MTMASRIAVMNHGRIAQLGTPSEIYEFPNSRFSAEFIGSVNLFAGRLAVDEPDHCVIASEEAGCDIHIEHGVTGTVGQPLWVALRPEKMVLSKRRPDAARNLTRGRVVEIGYLGSLSIYHVVLDGSGKRIRITMPNISRHPDEDITWEDEVWVTWEAGNAVVLNQ